VGPLHGSQPLPGARKLGSKAFEFFEVEGRECFETLGAIISEMQPDDAMVFVVPGTFDQPCLVSPVDEADRTVMA
jgi:hypothetical protein